MRSYLEREIPLLGPRIPAEPLESLWTMIGLRGIERRAHVTDLHATILSALGLDHKRVTYLHNGRSERPTIVTGEVVREAFA